MPASASSVARTAYIRRSLPTFGTHKVRALQVEGRQIEAARATPSQPRESLPALPSAVRNPSPRPNGAACCGRSACPPVSFIQLRVREHHAIPGQRVAQLIAYRLAARVVEVQLPGFRVREAFLQSVQHNLPVLRQGRVVGAFGTDGNLVLAAGEVSAPWAPREAPYRARSGSADTGGGPANL